jgi:hypothetical protein
VQCQSPAYLQSTGRLERIGAPIGETLPLFTGGNQAMICDDPQDTPMTVEERRLLKALANCGLPHSSPHKGLCLKILKAVTKSGRYRLTGDQRATLWGLGHYYCARLPEDVQNILKYRMVPRHKSER